MSYPSPHLKYEFAALQRLQHPRQHPPHLVPCIFPVQWAHPTKRLNGGPSLAAIPPSTGDSRRPSQRPRFPLVLAPSLCTCIQLLVLLEPHDPTASCLSSIIHSPRLDSPFIQPALAALHSFGLLLRFPRASFFFAACPLSLAISPIDHHLSIFSFASSLPLFFFSFQHPHGSLRAALFESLPQTPAPVRQDQLLCDSLIISRRSSSTTSTVHLCPRLLAFASFIPHSSDDDKRPIFTTAPWSRPLADGSMPPPPPPPYITSA